MELDAAIARSLLEERRDFLMDFLANPMNADIITQIAEKLANVLSSGGKILTCGNGGSLCDSMHFAEELTGRFHNNRRALPALSLCDPSYLTCVGNDFGFNSIFSRGVEAFGKPGDALIAISTSGKSENVLVAAKKAKEIGMTLVLLTGDNVDSELYRIADYKICTPKSECSDKIQEIHIKCIHIIINLIEKKLFG